VSGTTYQLIYLSTYQPIDLSTPSHGPPHLWLHRLIYWGSTRLHPETNTARAL